jgi:hypothetical protein
VEKGGYLRPFIFELVQEHLRDALERLEKQRPADVVVVDAEGRFHFPKPPSKRKGLRIQVTDVSLCFC